MNLLFLAPRLPLPADTGGKIRTLNILKQAAKVCSVDLVCFSFEKQDQGYIQELNDLAIDVHLVPMEEPTLVQKVFTVLFDKWPFSIKKYKCLTMEEKLKALLKERKFDAVHIDHLHMAHYHTCFPGVRCFVDEHNVEYKILERCANVEKNSFKRLLFANQAAKMKKFEGEVCRHFAAAFAVSKDDAALLRKITDNTVDVHVIPNGVDTAFFEKHAADQQAMENSLVFTGSMDWLPNDDAMTYFVKEVLPLIWEANDDVKLYIVGKSPSDALKQIGSQDKRIEVTGRVDDVRPYIDRSKVFIVPIRIGGGTRLKILEAFSMQKCVVSTSVGAEGISYTNGKDILIADDAETFAQQILTIIKEDERIASIGAAGRDLVKQTYDWSIIGKTLEGIYKSS